MDMGEPNTTFSVDLKEVRRAGCVWRPEQRDLTARGFPMGYKLGSPDTTLVQSQTTPMLSYTLEPTTQEHTLNIARTLLT